MKTVLIGWPISHSISPAIHNAAFHALGMEGNYSLLPVERAEDLGKTLAGLKRDPDWAGANVTVPYKEKIIPHLDRLEGAAAELKAVNTIVRRGDQLIGHNTDMPGFLADLEAKRNGRRRETRAGHRIGRRGARRGSRFDPIRLSGDPGGGDPGTGGCPGFRTRARAGESDRDGTIPLWPAW